MFYRDLTITGLMLVILIGALIVTGAQTEDRHPAQGMSKADIARLNEEANEFLEELTIAERREILVGSVKEAITQRFDVFATGYSTEATLAENEEAFGRLVRGIDNILAAANKIHHTRAFGTNTTSKKDDDGDTKAER